MSRTDEVKKLAALARIEVSDAEADTFAKEFDDILAYVGEIESLLVSVPKDAAPRVRNVFRKDEVSHDSGTHTKALAEQFRERRLLP